MANNGLPHTDEFEKAVLGSVLLDNSCLSLVLESLTTQDFYGEAHRLIFDAEVKLSESFYVIDYLTLSQHLRQSGQLTRCGGEGFVASLTDGMPVGTDHSVREYCRIVKEFATRRRALAISQQFVEQYASLHEGDPKGLVDRQILELSALITNGNGHGFEVIGDSFDKLDMDRVVFGKGNAGIPSGFKELDSLTNGFQPGELNLIAGRPGMGKSTAGLNIAAYAASHGYRVGFFSVEMNRESLLVRMMCTASGVNSHRLRCGASPEEISSSIEAVSKLRHLPVHIDDSSTLSVTDSRARASSLKNKHGLDILMFDYLQMMGGGKSFDFKGRREQEVAFVSRSLKAIAKELKIPVVAMAQLSREPEKGGKTREPNLTDLRESGGLEMDADIVIFLHHAQDAVDDGRGIVTDFLLKKNRNGPTGRVRLLFNRSCTRFEPYVEKTLPEYEEQWSRKRKRGEDD